MTKRSGPKKRATPVMKRMSIKDYLRFKLEFHTSTSIIFLAMLIPLLLPFVTLLSTQVLRDTYALAIMTSVTACMVAEFFAGIIRLSDFDSQSPRISDQIKNFTWSEEDKIAYDLGQQSKNWVPYLKSFLRPEATLPAYKLGLEDAYKAENTKRHSPKL